MVKSYVKDNIILVRSFLGLSKVDLGRAIGVDRTTISRWEKGINTPKSEKVALLMKICLENGIPLFSINQFYNEDISKIISNIDSIVIEEDYQIIGNLGDYIALGLCRDPYSSGLESFIADKEIICILKITDDEIQFLRNVLSENLNAYIPKVTWISLLFAHRRASTC